MADQSTISGSPMATTGAPGAKTSPTKAPLPAPPGPPLPAGVAKPPMAAAAAPVAGAAAQPGESQEPENPDAAVQLSFFQQPWVQNILPFVTSLTLHATIIIVAILFVKAIEIIKAPPNEEQVIVPDSNIVENSPPGGVPNQGLGADPFKQAAQDKTPDETSKGWAEKKGPTVSIESAGGGSGDASDSIISVGPGGGFGKGNSLGGGHGDGNGSGSGDGSGALAMFGTPGGGGIGPHGAVFGNGGNARTIVFVCDCTGSMITKIAQLKIELSRTVLQLHAFQFFNVIFYQDEKVLKLADDLIPATPENKRKCETWLEDIVTAGTTDPVPALTAALKSKAQLMYFLTDAADFPDVKAVQDVFSKFNADKKTRVNTILFVQNKEEQEANKESEPLMAGIAHSNGGTMKWVIADEL